MANLPTYTLTAWAMQSLPGDAHLAPECRRHILIGTLESGDLALPRGTRVQTGVLTWLGAFVTGSLATTPHAHYRLLGPPVRQQGDLPQESLVAIEEVPYA